jgi:osmotically-inducible protein OsmY
MKTDKEIQQDVLDELRWDPAVNAADVGVTVNNGAVTLSGQVDSYAAKLAAQRAAFRVLGVKSLAMELVVKLPGSGERTDSDIAQAAKSALTWSTFVPFDGVDVTVERGWVTLSGEVDWGYQRFEMTDTVSRLRGVKGVTDNVKVKARVMPTDVKTGIEGALKRIAQSDAEQLSVAVDGGRVTLSGPIHSLSERAIVTNAAWSAPGVTDVVDRLVVI